MTKLEELKTAVDACADAGCSGKWAAHHTWAAYDDAWDAYKAELKKVQEENPMTELEELKAAWVAADADIDAAHEAAEDAWSAYEAELNKTQEGTLMTRLEELKATRDAAHAAAYAQEYPFMRKNSVYAARSARSARSARAADDAWDARNAARDAYEAELKKTQEENSND